MVFRVISTGVVRLLVVTCVVSASPLNISRSAASQEPAGSELVQGQVRDRSGRGVPGVLIGLSRGGDIIATTDAEGFFTLRGLGDRQLLYVQHADYLPEQISILPGGSPYDVVLERGLCLIVDLQDSDEGAVVLESPRLILETGNSVSLYPFGEGYRSQTMPRRAGRGVIRCAKYDEVAVEWPAGTGAFDLGTRELRGFRARLSVTDAEGNPVQGARILVGGTQENGRGAFLPGARTETDARGTWWRGGVTGRDFDVTIHAEGFAPTGLAIEFDASYRAFRRTLVLRPGVLLKLRAVDVRGDPLKHARLSFKPWSRGRIPLARAHEDGVFRVHLPPGERIVCHLGARDCLPLDFAVGPAAEGAVLTLDHELRPRASTEDPGAAVLERGASLVGIVLDDEDRPISRVRVDLEGSSRSRATSVATTTDEDGNFAFHRLYSGDYFVSAGASVHRGRFFPCGGSDKSVTLDADEQVTCVLRVVRGFTYEGRLAYEDGSPAMGQVRIIDPARTKVPAEELRGGERFMGQVSSLGTPNGHALWTQGGGFTFEPLPRSGPLRLIARVPVSFRKRRPGDGPQSHERATFAVRVFDVASAADLPAAIRFPTPRGSATLALRLDGYEPYWIALRLESLDGLPASPLLDRGRTSDGQVRFEHLPPGRWRASLLPDRGQPSFSPQRFRVDLPPSTVVERRVSLREVELQEFRIRVVDTAGAPIAGARIGGAPARRPCLTGADGVFAFEARQAPRLHRVDALGYVPHRYGEQPVWQERECTIVLESAASLVVRMPREERPDVDLLRVVATPVVSTSAMDRHTRSSEVVTDSETFVLQGLTPGEYQILVEERGPFDGARRLSAEIPHVIPNSRVVRSTVLPGLVEIRAATETRVELTLPPLFEVTGRLRLGGVPIPKGTIGFKGSAVVARCDIEPDGSYHLWLPSGDLMVELRPEMTAGHYRVVSERSVSIPGPCRRDLEWTLHDVRVEVVDSSGSPVPDVSVSYGQQVQKTDEAGVAVLAEVVEGKTALRVQVPTGFSIEKRYAEVTIAEGASHRFVLEPQRRMAPVCDTPLVDYQVSFLDGHGVRMPVEAEGVGLEWPVPALYVPGWARFLEVVGWPRGEGGTGELLAGVVELDPRRPAALQVAAEPIGIPLGRVRCLRVVGLDRDSRLTIEPEAGGRLPFPAQDVPRSVHGGWVFYVPQGDYRLMGSSADGTIRERVVTVGAEGTIIESL